jgi:hypothetical protein
MVSLCSHGKEPGMENGERVGGYMCYSQVESEKADNRYYKVKCETRYGDSCL